jgi:hypothetical protein
MSAPADALPKVHQSRWLGGPAWCGAENAGLPWCSPCPRFDDTCQHCLRAMVAERERVTRESPPCDCGMCDHCAVVGTI